MALMRKKPGEGEVEDGGTSGGGPVVEQPAQGSSDGATEPSKESPVAAEEPSASSESRQREKSDEAKDSKKSRDSPPRKKDDDGKRAARPKGEVVAKTRSRVAQLVWLLFVVAALFLAVGALCVALGANKDNGAVRFILDGAKFFDLGIFSRSNGIKTFDGAHAAIKNALFNWGIAAVLYLVVGRILERIIRP